jgi:hypothetical protein
MKRASSKNVSGSSSAWTLDQLAKSQFFHEKLHAWGLLEISAKIEKVKGEKLKWQLEELGVSQTAWDKVIHRGIKPVKIFAHPDILQRIDGAVGYYRMLSMVSQKSMIRVGLATTRYETGKAKPDDEIAFAIARHLNRIISALIELDEKIDAREFDLWRGMAAGAQAQGSWQNAKGSRIEVVIRGIIQLRLREKELITEEESLVAGDEVYGSIMHLKDGRAVIFADDPDVAIHGKNEIESAVEIKGGIDAAGVLERIGAAIKSLRRAKEVNPKSVTVLILQGVSVTETARKDLEISRDVVNYWFTVEEVLEDDAKRQELFDLLRI